MDIYTTDSTQSLAHVRKPFLPCASAPEQRLIKVYPSQTYQTIVGFGAALTEASGVVYSQLPTELKERFIELCFGKEGNAYSLSRLAIQSCDFSLAPRAYAHFGKGARNATFSIDDDWGYILPFVFDAQAANPSLTFIASPWSPPAWAKTNLNMKYGGHLRKKHYRSWATLIARFVAEYRALGVNIERITVQNEPEAIQIWESCLFNPEQEKTFVRDYLRRALDEAGLAEVKIFIWDHNKQSMLDRTMAVMADPQAADCVDGVAFHWYSGDHFEAVRATRDVIGNRELIFTEGCDFFTNGDPWWEIPHAEHYAREVIGDLENGANGIIDWNILLNAQGGPNHVGNWCDAPIMYDDLTGQLNVRKPFYYLGHFSRFIQPRAKRMLTTRYTTDLEATSFANPDGSFATVVLNRFDKDINFTLLTEGGVTERRSISLTSRGHSITTLVWRPGLAG